MKIRNLDTFYWIAKLGSFRAAADKLNLTQPAVSARIQILEQDLGKQVFIREIRHVELTPEGHKLLDYAERYMDLEQEILNGFSDSTNIQQKIRVGASETIVTTWLPEFMSHFSQSHKRLSFDLRVDSSNGLRNALVSREIDLAFLMGPISEVSITNHEICSYEMIFAALPALAVHCPKWSLKDIIKYPVLTFASDTKPNRQLRELLVDIPNANTNITTSTSLGAVVQLAKSGMGICAVPRAVIRNELDAGVLCELKTSVVLPSISFTASYVCGPPLNVLMESISDNVMDFLDNRTIKNIYQD